MLMARGDDITLGPADAAVTLLTYAEFHQTTLARRWMTTWGQLRKKYGDNLRIVVRHNPLPYHADADLVGQAAQGVFERAGAAAFVAFVDALAAKEGSNSIDVLAAEAARAGAGPAAVMRQALENNVWAPRIKAHRAEAEAAKASGVPTSFINGALFMGAQPFPKVVEALDQELAAAQALAGKGTTKGRVSLDRTHANLVAVGLVDPSAGRPALPPGPEQLVAGKSIGPFYLGMTLDDVKKTGYRLAPHPDSWICVKTNPSGDACPYDLHIKDGRADTVWYRPTDSVTPLIVNGKAYDRGTPLSGWTQALKCPASPSTGASGSTWKCSDRTGVFVHDSHCSGTPPTQVCERPGVREVVNVILGAYFFP